jgi:2-dehydropantoate 2-reductase
MKTKILVYGAGVIGSIFAGKLSLAGNDVTILARGKRYEEISSDGLILKDAMTGKTSRIGIKCIPTLQENDIYDYVLVVVQNNQIDEILPVLSKNQSSNFVFVVNNPLGYSKYINAVGKERVMIGFPSAGGERRDGIVSYFIGTGFAKIMQTTTFGEVDGSRTQRLINLVSIFRKAGFDPTISNNMDAWQKTHVAFVVPIANALLRFESNNYKLAKSRETIHQMILATREGFRAMKENGIPVEPQKLNYYFLPVWLLGTVFQLIFATRIAEYSMAKHTAVAKQEIEILEKQFLGQFPAGSFENWLRLKQ